MAKKVNNFWERIKEWSHNLVTKISLSFKGKHATFEVSIDLTQNLDNQLKGIEHTLRTMLPETSDIQNYVKALPAEEAIA